MVKKAESGNRVDSCLIERDIDMSIKKSVSALVEEAISKKAFPGAVVCYGDGENFWLVSSGRLTYEDDSPEVESSTIYDIASLTKIFTTTAVLILATNRMLGLDDYLDRYLGGNAFPGVTIRHSLAHTAGLTLSLSSLKNLPSEEIDRVIRTTGPTTKPGSQFYYSNQGFYLLGKVIEKISHDLLGNVFQKIMFEPIGLKSTLSNPPASAKSYIAPTEYDSWRGRQIWGEVHDEVAYKMGGLCGHAGLFSTAEDLYKLGVLWLGQGVIHGKILISPDLINQGVINNFPFASNVSEDYRQNFSLGWRLNDYKFTGNEVSGRIYNFSGFTGPSLMIDPERKMIIAIMENRVYPSRSTSVERYVYHARITTKIYKGIFS